MQHKMSTSEIKDGWTFCFLQQEGEVKKGDAVVRLVAPSVTQAATGQPADNELQAQAKAAPQAASFTYVITDPLGIHARPAGAIVKLVKGFDCQITLKANGKTARAGRMIDLMKLGAVQGTTLEVSGTGAETAAALQALQKFMTEKL